MRKRTENSTIFALVIVLAAVAAGMAHVHIDGVSHSAEVPSQDAPAATESTLHEAAVSDSAEWNDYSPSAHCGLGNGLHDITAH